MLRRHRQGEKIDKRSPEVVARDVLDINQLGDLEHNDILLRWHHTLEKFSDLLNTSQ